MNYLLALLLGFFLQRVQMAMTAWNYSVPWNGFGCINAVNEGKTKAPMAYRVLVPWLIFVLEKIGLPENKRVVAYEVIKILLNSFAIFAVGMAFGTTAAILFTALLPITFKFDYWDWTLEVAAIMFGVSGNLPLAIIAAFIAGLSRETAILIDSLELHRRGDCCPCSTCRACNTAHCLREKTALL